MTIKKPVSPQASGGAGTLFEYRVAAIAYSYLLTGTHPPGLSVPVMGVGLQQRVNGSLLDDIVLTAEAGPSSLSTEYQVKINIAATGSDEPFVATLVHALHVLNDRQREVVAGDLDIGLVARGGKEALDQLAQLANIARGHRNHETFDRLFQPHVVNHDLRQRLDHVRQAVATAIADNAPSLGGVEASTHAVLSRLHVWLVSDHDDGSDFLAALDRLTPLAEGYGVEPIVILGHLAAIAQEWGVVAGVCDSDSLRRQLRRRGLGLRKQAADTDRNSPNNIDADAVWRGPVAALELDGDLEEAERLFEAGDPTAADKFGAIAAALENNRYQPHAAVMRRREASARQRTSQVDEAILSRVRLAWDHLDAAQVWEAGFALHDGVLATAPETAGAQGLRIWEAAEAAVWVSKGNTELVTLAQAFDALEPGDPYRERTAARLCEEAIADDSPDIVLSRVTELEAVARTAARQTDGPSRQAGARIQMCIADATDGWPTLLPELQRHNSRNIVAWAQARFARYLALKGDGAGAKQQYLTAIEKACVLDMYDEAAGWLYSLRTVRFWYGDFDTDQQHPLAQALRTSARPSQLPGAPHTAELALRALTDETKLHEASQRARRWRWQTVVRAHLTEELDAARALGKSLQHRGELADAIACYIRAGAEKPAVAAAQSLPDSSVHLPTALPAVTVCRAAAFAAVAAAADLISDDHAREWIALAMDEISSDEQERRGVPSARMRAVEVIAAFRDLLPDSMLEVLTRQMASLFDRRTDLNADAAMIKVLETAARTTDKAVPLIAQALQADEHLAEAALTNAGEAYRSHHDAFAKLLKPLNAPNERVHLALIIAGITSGLSRDYAAEKVDQYLEPRVYPPGQLAFHGNSGRIALYASILAPEKRAEVARTMLARALERREPTSNRRDSLRGLFQIVGELSDQDRHPHLPAVMEMARGLHDGGPADDILAEDQRRAGDHGSAAEFRSLADAALKVAARIAMTEMEQVEVFHLGLELLRTVDEPGQWRIGQALALLTAPPPDVDLHRCALHPSPPIRALAAFRWAADTSSLSETVAMRLARDEVFEVRKVMAEALHENQEHLSNDATASAAAAILASDNRRSIRVLAAPVTE